MREERVRKGGNRAQVVSYVIGKGERMRDERGGEIGKSSNARNAVL